MFAFGFATYSELLSLCWNQVDLEARILTLNDTKASRPHIRPLPDQVVALFQELLPAHLKDTKQFVFMRSRHKLGLLDKTWRLMKQIGAEGVRFHDNRRLVGVRVFNSTGSLEMVGRVLNQSRDYIKQNTLSLS